MNAALTCDVCHEPIRDVHLALVTARKETFALDQWAVVHKGACDTDLRRICFELSWWVGPWEDAGPIDRLVKAGQVDKPAHRAQFAAFIDRVRPSWFDESAYAPLVRRRTSVTPTTWLLELDRAREDAHRREPQPRW